MTALARLGRRLRDVEDRSIDESALRDVRRRLLTTPTSDRSRARSPWLLSSIALAVAAVASLVLFLRKPAPVTFVVAEQTGVLGAWIAAPAAAALPVRFSDGTLFALDPEARARVTATDARGARLLIERGRAHAEVVPHRQGYWDLTVGPFDVVVTGTQFDVEWDASEEHFTLALNEGSVTVSGPILGEARKVRAGEKIEAFCREKRAQISSVSDPTVQIAPEMTAPIQATDDGSTAPLPSLDSTLHQLGNAVASSPAQEGNAPGWRELLGAGKYSEAVDAADKLGFERACERATPAELISLGDAARFAGKPARAIVAFRAVRSRFPADARASAAAFEIGRMVFDQHASYSEAAKWFATYLRERPTGPLAREASGRLVESLARQGDVDGAREAAVSYLARYPNGPHAPLARSLVGK